MSSPSVTLSSPDKVLWPATGHTKRDLWDYLSDVADRLLPQVADRPLTLVRFPDGLDGSSFVQKHLPTSAPAELDRYCTWSESSKREVCYLLARSVEDLRWTAQSAALELHPWLARVDKPERPDTLMFDLDPGEASIPVARAAHLLREVLDTLGLVAMVKTSGKRGLHVVVPVERRYPAEQLRAFGLAVARATAARHPDDLTVEMRKANRGERLLLDWSRNGGGQTVVAAWSPRAHPLATVSMPLSWDEVDEALDPTAFTIATALERPDRWADPVAPQRIERARSALADQGFPSEDRSPRSSRPVG